MASCIAKWSLLAIATTYATDINEIYNRAMDFYYKVSFLMVVFL